MITRFYVDNYKCLSNFEYKPKPFELIVGANGTGKTTVFEALDKVRRFVTGQADALELFPPSCGTRWDSRAAQIFEVEYQIGDATTQYRLEVNLASSAYRVEKEMLKRNGQITCETVWQKERVEDSYPDDIDDSGSYTDEEHEGELRAIKYGRGENLMGLTAPNQSFLQVFPVGGVVKNLSKIQCIKLNPSVMTSRVGRIEPRPTNDLSNFASHYLYVLQQKQGRMFEMMPYLREAVSKFDSFAIQEDFEEARRDLRIVFQRPNSKRSADSIRYGFEELSDGQRALIALYTLLFCTLEPDTTLIIDEPENYVALRELQPWLMLLQERIEEHGGQVILISHHPEFINALAPNSTVIFERENGGPVRIKEFDPKLAESLAPSEVIARGWESESQ